VIGSLGPFGFSEISMAFFFHPVMSFILPLAFACVMIPSLQGVFPGVGLLTSGGLKSSLVRIYICASFAPIIAMNSGGAVNLTVNVAILLIAFWGLWRWSRPDRSRDGREILNFGRWGIFGLVVYLATLYGVTYPLLRPNGLPSSGVQLLTLALYAVPVLGLLAYRPRHHLPIEDATINWNAWRRVIVVFTSTIVLAYIVLMLADTSKLLGLVILPNFVIWTVLGFVLTVLSVVMGLMDRLGGESPTENSTSRPPI
jgi:hypothetical protein